MIFGEKYGDSVRTIQFGESIELCRGIHVNLTSQIGQFRIISEGSISSGIRRIEAFTGEEADYYINQKLTTLKNISDILKQPTDILEAVKVFSLKIPELKKIIEENRKSSCKTSKIRCCRKCRRYGALHVDVFKYSIN